MSFSSCLCQAFARLIMGVRLTDDLIYIVLGFLFKLGVLSGNFSWGSALVLGYLLVRENRLKQVRINTVLQRIYLLEQLQRRFRIKRLQDKELLQSFHLGLISKEVWMRSLFGRK